MHDSQKFKTQIPSETGRLQDLIEETDQQTAWNCLAEAAQEGNLDLLSFFESCPDGILAACMETGEFQYANPVACNLFGYRREEFPGMKVGNLSPDDRAELHREYFAECVRGRKSFLERLPCRRKDGTLLYVDISIAKTLFPGAKPSLIGFFRDVTARIKAEKERLTLQRLSSHLTDRLTARQIGKLMAQECYRLFEHDAFWLSRYDSAKNTLSGLWLEDTPLGEHRPTPEQYPDVLPLHTQPGICPTGKPKLINRANEPRQTDLIPFGETRRLSRSLMFAPIRWQGKVVGLLSVQSYQPGKYRDEDLDLLQILADQCGGALLRVQAEDSLQKAYGELEQRIQERTAELLRTNQELQREIVQRKRLEEERKRSEHMRKLFMESALDPMNTVDLNGEIVYANAAHEQVVGYRPDEIVGNSIWQLIHENSYVPPYALDKETVRQTLAHKGSLSLDLVWKHKEGRPVEGRTNIVAIYDKSGQLAGVHQVFHDLSERFRAERERESLQRLSQKLTGPLPIERIGKIIAKESRSLFHHDAFALCLIDEERQEVGGIYFEDTPQGAAEPREVPGVDFPASLLADTALMAGHPLIVDRQKDHEPIKFVPFGDTHRISQSLLFCPILWKEKTIGILTVQSYTPARYSRRDLRLLKAFSDQLGGAIARLHAERALERSKEFLSILMNHIPDPIFVIDENHQCVMLNDATCRLAGRPRKDLIDRSAYTYCSQEQADIWRGQNLLVFGSGRPSEIQEPFINAEGEQRILWTKRTLCEDPSGKRVIVGISRDITEQKDAEQALHLAYEKLETRVRQRTHQLSKANDDLQQSRAHLAAVLDAVPGILCWVDCRKMTYLGVNQKAADLTGAPIKAVPEKSINFTGTVEEFASLVHDFTVDDRLEISREIGVRDANGECKELLVFGRKYLDGHRAVFVGIDITERNHARKALLESEKRYRTLFESARDGIFITSRDGTIIEANPALMKLFGFAKGDLTEIQSAWRQFNLKDQKTGIEEDAIPQDREIQLPRKDGTMVDCWITFDAWRHPNGALGGYQGIVWDITEKKRSDEERCRLEQMRKDFISNASHEFKTPLTAIRGYAETLLQKALNDEKASRNFVKIILDQAIRLQRLTENLLQMSQLEEEKLTVQFTPVSIAEVVRSCLEPVRIRAEQKHLSMEIDCPPTLPPVQGDSWWLRHALQNLLDNAIHYTPPEGKITMKADVPERDWVRVSVADSGIGIPKDKQDQIFERFYRVDASRSRRVGGTGLGLAIVKEVVEAHKGRIEVASEPGRGSTFRVYLPCKQS